MKICVLQPDYSTTGVDYKNYDPQRNLSSLLPDDEVDHVSLNKLTTYRQLKELKKKNYDVFVNLCEGYLEWSVPSIDVVYFLEQLLGSSALATSMTVNSLPLMYSSTSSGPYSSRMEVHFSISSFSLCTSEP